MSTGGTGPEPSRETEPVPLDGAEGSRAPGPAPGPSPYPPYVGAYVMVQADGKKLATLAAAARYVQAGARQDGRAVGADAGWHI